MGIVNYCIRQDIAIYFDEVSTYCGRGILKVSYHSCPTGRISVASNFKKNQRKKSVMGSVISNVPCYKLYTWIRVVSTGYVFQKTLEHLFFRTFQNTCLNYLARKNFCMLLQGTLPFFQYLLSRCLFFRALLYKV